jgi:hypothetical protein
MMVLEEEVVPQVWGVRDEKLYSPQAKLPNLPRHS